MADDTLLNPGIGGDTIVTDSLGGVPERKVQAVKLMLGASGVEGALVDASNPLPVTGTVAATLTEPISVDDNGASLTVDVGTALPTGDNNIGNVDVVTLPALPAGTNNIGDVDVLSVVPGTGAASLGKAEDEVAGSGDTGVAALAVRRDTPGTGIGANGDYAFLEVTSTGQLRVDTELPAAAALADSTSNPTVPGVGAFMMGWDEAGANWDRFPVAGEDDASPANPRGVPMMYRARGTPTAEIVTNGDWSCVSGTNNGGIFVREENYPTEDAVAVANPIGPQLMARRRDTLANETNTDGDVTALNCSQEGALHVAISADTTQIAAGNGTAAAALRVTLANDSTGIVGATCTGAAAHDSAVSGNPVLIGLEARTSDGTAVSNGDAVRAMASTLGKLVVLPGSIPQNQTQGNANRTNTSAVDLIAAAGAGIKIAIMSITVTNRHATQGTDVTIRDGTSAKFGPQYAGPEGGGFSANGGGFPLFISTADTAVTAICSDSANTNITVTGYLTTE